MKVYPVRSKADREKIEMILKATNKRDYLLWILGSNTGFRISDIIRLKVKDVKGNFITLIEQKTGKERSVKINKKLKAVLKDYIKGMDDNAVLFKSRVGGNKPICIRRCQQIIKKVAELVGIEKNINSHSMRKTYAYNIYKTTGSLALVMEALNNSKEKVTLRYLCLVDEMLEDATEAIADM